MNYVVMAILLAALLFLAMLTSMDVGYRVGHRRKLGNAETSIEVIGTVDAAVFGLLGLILAFTFSGASDRLIVRRAQIVQEANAIGTAYLRLDVLPPSEQPVIRNQFRQYLELRIEAFDKIQNEAASNRALQESERLQREIWSRSAAACGTQQRTDTCLLLLPALNEMIDITTTRKMAAKTHAPTIIMSLLLILSLCATMLCGFAMSRQDNRSILHMVLLSLVIACSVYVVLDLDYPRAGLINLKSMDGALHQLRDTMKQ